MKVTVYYSDKDTDKEIYYDPKSFKEAAWKYWNKRPRDGEHTVVVREGVFTPVEVKYKTSELRDYQKERKTFKKGSHNLKESSIQRKKGWFYSLNGENAKGPVPENSIIEKVKGEVISETTLVWKNGMEDWQKISKTAEFKDLFDQASPPPLPNKQASNNRDIFKSRKINNSKTHSEPDTSEDLFSRVKVNRSTKRDDQTNRWLNFYINIRIPFGIFILLLNVFVPPNYLLPYEANNFQIIGACFIVVSLILFFGLYKRKLWGWKFNWLFIFLEPILAAFAAADEPGQLLLFIVLGLLIYSLPNYIYFKKRKHLFT